MPRPKTIKSAKTIFQARAYPENHELIREYISKINRKAEYERLKMEFESKGNQTKK